MITKPSNYLSGANYAVYQTIPEAYRKLGDSPILDMKVLNTESMIQNINKYFQAIKNDVEVNGMIESHIRDAMALCEWAAFMEQQIQVAK